MALKIQRTAKGSQSLNILDLKEIQSYLLWFPCFNREKFKSRETMSLTQGFTVISNNESE